MRGIKNIFRPLYKLSIKTINFVFGFKDLVLIEKFKIFRYQRKSLIEKYKIEFAIDVGANVGQWVEEIRKDFIFEIHSFEPNKTAYSELIKKNIPNIKAFNFGLGSKNDFKKLNNWTFENSMNSFLKLSDFGQKHLDVNNSLIDEVTVEIKTLDSLYKTNSLNKNILLKIDVQGFELEVLKGSKELLSKISIVEIEAPILNLYEGSTNITELILFLESQDFIISSISTERFYNFSASDSDLLFIRKDLLNK